MMAGLPHVRKGTRQCVSIASAVVRMTLLSARMSPKIRSNSDADGHCFGGECGNSIAGRNLRQAMTDPVVNGNRLSPRISANGRGNPWAVARAAAISQRRRAKPPPAAQPSFFGGGVALPPSRRLGVLWRAVPIRTRSIERSKDCHGIIRLPVPGSHLAAGRRTRRRCANRSFNTKRGRAAARKRGNATQADRHATE